LGKGKTFFSLRRMCPALEVGVWRRENRFLIGKRGKGTVARGKKWSRTFASREGPRLLREEFPQSERKRQEKIRGFPKRFIEKKDRCDTVEAYKRRSPPALSKEREKEK